MFNIESSLIIWTSISFGILVLLLYRTALPPIIVFLKEREKMISDSITVASDNRRKSDELLLEYKKKLADAGRSADQIIDAAKEESRKLKDEILARAANEAGMILERTKHEISKEKQKIVSEVRTNVADIVVMAASKLLRRSITMQDNKKLIEESLKEIEK